MDEQLYYTPEEYDQVKEDLPKVLAKARAKVAECLVPTWSTKMKILDTIKKFIRENERIVYGGTAINELVKKANAADSIYKPYQFADIEFYSPEPAADIVKLCDILYHEGYDNVQGVSAQHDETYSLRADFTVYCDITYMPRRISSGVMTMEINGIKYAHPHFIMIDMFRIFNQPLTAAEQRWEKTYERMYKLQEYYPFKRIKSTIRLNGPDEDIATIITNFKSNFFKETRSSMLVSGYDACNLIYRYVQKHKLVTKNPKASKRLNEFISPTPYLELVSTNYASDVRSAYAFIKKQIPDPENLSLKEFWPLFQFLGFSVNITYKDRVVLRIIQSDGFCVPHIETSSSYNYVGYQYVLMTMMIKRFAAYLDRNDKEERLAAGAAISNLMTARGIFLALTGERPINNTPITDFKVNCIGETVDFRREYFTRLQKMFEQGKRTFKYEPASYFSKTEEERAKSNFDPTTFNYKNSSGNQINTDKCKWFPLDSSNDIIDTKPESDPDLIQE